MQGRIYLIDQDETLQALPEQPYDSEDLLQALLAKYPDLMAGEQMNEDAPRRWLLISREYGVPGEEEGYNRWSLDHLFLDQDGIPTLVEVKRSTDTRIRREVVGQMLDYAANAVAYWPVERMQQEFVAAAKKRGDDPVQLVLDLLDASQEAIEEVDAFWARVKTNLQAGRIRLVFVADRIPAELRRIVEFLNQQMDPAEVLAVEIRQYVGEGLKTLVSKVVGQTAEAQRKKTAGTRSGTSVWNEERFLREITAHQGEQAASMAKAVLDWAEQKGLRIWWGKGATHGSFFPMFDQEGENHSFASFWTHTGAVEIQFQYMKEPFTAEAKRFEWLHQLNDIPGVQLDPKRISARPSFPIKVLAEADNLQRFLDLWEGYLAEIKAS